MNRTSKEAADGDGRFWFDDGVLFINRKRCVDAIFDRIENLGLLVNSEFGSAAYFV